MDFETGKVFNELRFHSRPFEKFHFSTLSPYPGRLKVLRKLMIHSVRFITLLDCFLWLLNIVAEKLILFRCYYLKRSPLKRVLKTLTFRKRGDSLKRIPLKGSLKRSVLGLKWRKKTLILISVLCKVNSKHATLG